MNPGRTPPDRAAGTTYLTFPNLLKASPSEEGGGRFLYFEASNEAKDLQGEVFLQKALSESADYYLRHGNLDIDHITQVGARQGIPDYNLFEIGRPVDVRLAPGSTFVKAELYRGAGPMAERANQVWESLTAITPPARWFPSVGGAVLDKSQELDPKTRTTRTVIRKVRWTNIGLSRTPVNQTVPTVSTIPVGVLAKCWGAGGLDLNKALEAGAGVTDAAAMTGGAAPARQSLDRGLHSYWTWRDKAAAAHRRDGRMPTPRSLAAHAEADGANPAEAVDLAERFIAAMERQRQRIALRR